jgi:hypothetical protein
MELLLAKIKPVQLPLLAEHDDARRRSSAFQQPSKGRSGLSALLMSLELTPSRGIREGY